MHFRIKMMASAAAIALSTGFAQADGHISADTVVATVDGANVTLGQVVMLVSQLPPQYQQLEDDVLFNGMVDQLVNQEVLGATLEEEPVRMRIAIENEIRSLRAGEVVNALSKLEITEEDLQAAYDAAFADVDPDPEFNASHILVATEEEAIAVKELIDGGADFAQTAVDNSTGPSGPSGGELGWFGAGMMVPEFEEAVVALETGEVSDPVETQFGWHVVKLNETRTPDLPTLDDMREELTNGIRQTTLTTTLEELKAAADVELLTDEDFDFSLIRNLDVLEN